MKLAKFSLLCASMAIGCSQVYSGINLSYSASQLTVSFDAPVNFTSSQSFTPGSVSLVLSNIYTTGETQIVAPVSSPTILLDSTFAVANFFQNDTANNDVQPEDLRLVYSGFSGSVTSGQTLNISIGTAISSVGGGFPPASLADPDNVGSTIDLFLVDNSGNRFTNIITVAVPEPSTFALLAGLMGLAVVMVRRKR